MAAFLLTYDQKHIPLFENDLSYLSTQDKLMGLNNMPLQPKTKVEDLLEKFTSFSRDKVLSEFELLRYLNQAKSIINIDPAQSWHIRGLAYFYANNVDEMDHAFRTALNLNCNNIILSNAIACYMNQGGIHAAFKLFEPNVSYFIETRDFELFIKLHRLALNLYELSTIERLIELLEPYNDIKEVNHILETIKYEVEAVNNKFLLRADVKWSEANSIANEALEVIKSLKIRPNSIVEIDFLDGEIINSFYVFSEIHLILKANDLLFEKIYSNNLLNIWHKVMFIFLCSKDEDLVRDVA